MGRKTALIGRLVIYTAILLVFAVIPTSFMERGSLCLFYLTTGHHCPFCGLTRAFSNVMHFNLIRAWDFNHLIVFFFPLFMLIIANDAYALVRIIRGDRRLGFVEKIVRETLRH